MFHKPKFIPLWRCDVYNVYIRNIMYVFMRIYVYEWMRLHLFTDTYAVCMHCLLNKILIKIVVNFVRNLFGFQRGSYQNSRFVQPICSVLQKFDLFNKTIKFSGNSPLKFSGFWMRRTIFAIYNSGKTYILNFYVPWCLFVDCPPIYIWHEIHRYETLLEVTIIKFEI